MGLFGKKKQQPDSSEPKEVTLGSGVTVKIAKSVNCLGDSCPRPQLMTKKAVNEIGPDDVIEVIVDNPSSMEAIPPMCHEINCTHLETVKGDRGWNLYIRKD